MLKEKIDMFSFLSTISTITGFLSLFKKHKAGATPTAPSDLMKEVGDRTHNASGRHTSGDDQMPRPAGS